MSKLLTALNLPTPASLAGAKPALPATASAAPPPKKAPNPQAAADMAELDKAVAEATKVWTTLADDAAKDELARAVKDAKDQRGKAMTMGDANGRLALAKSVGKQLGDKATKIKATAIDRARGAVGMKPADKPEEEKKDGSFKPKFDVVTDKGKLGIGGGAEAELEQKTKQGDKVSCTAAFEGKAWVETKPVDAYDPDGDISIAFHLVVGGKASASRKREQAGEKAGGGVGGSASVELELTVKHTMKPADTAAYIAAVKDAKGGGWEELRALQLAAHGSMADARALVASLGGKPRGGPQEDDETEQKLTSTLEGNADVASNKGAFGIALSVGASASGSLTRKTLFKDGSWWITLKAESENTKRGAVGVAFEGIGLTQSKEKSTHQSRAVTFVIDPKKPELKALLVQVQAATTMEQMLALRAKNPGVSFDVKTSGDADGDGTAVTVLGVGIGGEQRGFGSETEIDGPDGKTKIYDGGNTSGAHLIVGDKPKGGSTTTDRFTGGAGPDNKGFGESTETDRSGDLLGGLGAVVDKMKTSPLTTAKNVVQGKEELSKDVTHIDGAAFSDESYGQLAERAKQGDGKWIKYLHWRGSMNTLADWRAIRPRLVKAGENRQEIAKVVAEFERGSGRGRHETVRNAISGTEVAFELPPAIAAKKPYWDANVVNDPVPAALGAPSPDEVVKKLEQIDRQLTGFRNDMSKSQGDFLHLVDFQDMAERIDARRIAVAAALKTARAKAKAADDEAKGVNQFSAPEANVSSADSPEERERVAKLAGRIEQLKQTIGDAYQQEQAHFVAWEKHLAGDTVLGFIPAGVDGRKLVEHEIQLKGLYPKWDAARAELRKVLGEAGKPYDPGEADAVQPDRARYRALRKRDPQVGWQRPDGV